MCMPTIAPSNLPTTCVRVRRFICKEFPKFPNPYHKLSKKQCSICLNSSLWKMSKPLPSTFRPNMNDSIFFVFVKHVVGERVNQCSCARMQIFVCGRFIISEFSATHTHLCARAPLIWGRLVCCLVSSVLGLCCWLAGWGDGGVMGKCVLCVWLDIGKKKCWMSMRETARI